LSGEHVPVHDEHDDGAPYRLAAELRRVVADEVAAQRRRAREAGRSLDPLDRRQMARAILNRDLDLRARESLRLGEQPLSDAERAQLVRDRSSSRPTRTS
jgi:hypothetical protein